ncbi:MAG: glycoside hydrolase family 20 zincin-like fold domain-containing protein [Kiritimatiellae bacterium]|nr:glycoside hydrolase family 20 zincin-like fold domain-containing protein [Kiritimatiellia bacterium]MDD5520140.1 glycoside hydrolase family 20 zincin-like fold domain-containing protein [Kiritimatiellia bacterium]
MKLSLIPQPKSIRFGKGFLEMPVAGTVYIADGMFRDAAEEACSFLSGYSVTTASSKNILSFVRNGKLPSSGYKIEIGRSGILVEAKSSAGAFWGVQTLRQIIAQSGGKRLPLLVIKDWPDFENRGVYYDVSRGRIPKTERLRELVDRLSRYKINQLQFYVEHTFLFHGHPDIGEDASSLTAEDILELDELCRDRYIELVPSLASLGHLTQVLALPRYRHFAEDWGIGKYISPDAEKLPAWQRRIAWSLSPANPETYVFLESLFDEFLPLFSSNKFNVCCDETWDLGLGQSYELCRKRGKGRVYLDHILKLRELAAKYGKKIMFWGDIIRKYPELLNKIPDDVTLLDWGYDHNHPFGRAKDCKKAGLKFYVCPGTGSWNALFPRLHEAVANIHGFALAGKKNGADGLLNTDWGDGGHYNFMEFSWFGYLFGAGQAWNVKADIKDFAGKFCHTFLSSNLRDISKALIDLGDITQLQVRKNRSIWQELFFAVPGDDIFGSGEKDGWICRNGKIVAGKVKLNKVFGRKTIKKLQQIRKVFVAHSGQKNEDQLKVLPYWIFAVDTLVHSARKLTVLGQGGRDTKSNRRVLRSEMNALMGRFKSLWLERNRISEINITIDKYRKVLSLL